MTEKFRQHYWSHLQKNTEYVTEKQFIYAFNESQKTGTWNSVHAHENCGELVFVSDGIMVVCAQNASYCAQKNRAIWIPPRVKHEWYMPTNTIDRSLYIHESAFNHANLNALHIIEVSPLLREMVIAMDELGLDFEMEVDKRLGMALIDRVCAAQKCTDMPPIPQNHKLIKLCTEFIITPDMHVELSDWSAQVHVSEKTLARIFMKETGLNFREWKRAWRMQNAKKDLEAGAQVTETALNCGYSSLSSFIAAFKKNYGVSPSKFHKNI